MAWVRARTLLWPELTGAEMTDLVRGLRSVLVWQIVSCSCLLLLKGLLILLCYFVCVIELWPVLTPKRLLTLTKLEKLLNYYYYLKTIKCHSS